MTPMGSSYIKFIGCLLGAIPDRNRIAVFGERSHNDGKTCIMHVKYFNVTESDTRKQRNTIRYPEIDPQNQSLYDLWSILTFLTVTRNVTV